MLYGSRGTFNIDHLQSVCSVPFLPLILLFDFRRTSCHFCLFLTAIMFSLRNSLPFLATLLLPDLSFAAGIKRQTAAASSAPTATSGVPAGPTTTLQPVLPPNNNSEDFGLLSPDTSLTLHYGGVTNSTASKRDDTNSAILVNLDFVFLYPSVALDYSTFISGVSCTGNNTLVGLVSTSDAYSYIKTAWNGTDNILLITSAGGCGGDNQNDVFLAQSIEFDDAEQSFTATGEEHLAREVASTTDITWGNVIPSKLKKRAHRTLVSDQEHPLPCSSTNSGPNPGRFNRTAPVKVYLPRQLRPHDWSHACRSRGHVGRPRCTLGQRRAADYLWAGGGQQYWHWW